jgi:hypothetical protein
MRRFLPLFSLLVLCSCSLFSHHVEETPSIVERAIESGKANIEIESVATFDRAELPAGIEAKDVFKIITLKDDPIQTFPGESAAEVIFDKATGQPISIPPKQPKSSAPASKASREIIVMKDGTVLAGKDAAGQLENLQTVKPSRAWVFWLLAGVTVLLGVTWGVKSLAPVFGPAARIVGFVGGLFKRG